jgi:ribosomal protein L11 methyltransferase
MMLDGLPPHEPTYVARIVADETSACRIADLLGESFEPTETAVAAFERPDGSARPPWLVEVYFRTPPDETAVTRLVGLAAGGNVEVAFASFGWRDWVSASLAGLPPVPAGRFTVHGRHDRSRVPGNCIGIEIEAALAFGTGHHGTTRGCLLALDTLLKRGHPSRLLDLGTGTGVLAIAMARALHCPVLATDIDPQAIATARDNLRLNKAARYVTTTRARGTTGHLIQTRRPFDLVFANILVGPLVRLAAPMARMLAPQATVVLSGLLHAQANAALAAYRMQNLVLVRRYVIDEWTTLVLRRGGQARPASKGGAPS